MSNICTNIDLSSAILLWWDGSKLDAYCLFGITSIWNGRIAKIMTIVGSIPLLLELIGEERIQNSYKSFLGKTLRPQRWIFVYFNKLFMRGMAINELRSNRYLTKLEIETQQSIIHDSAANRLPVLALTFVFTLVSFWICSFIFQFEFSIYILLGIWLIMLPITFLLLIILSIAMFTSFSSLLKTTVKYLQNKDLCRYVRILAFVVLAIGLMFDLLMS